ncbi:MAG: FeoA domain-containing protein [Acidobacteriota bacterium]
MSELLQLRKPALEPGSRASGIECPLCGKTSGHSAAACSICPIGSSGCGTLTCPRCGYRFVPEVRWLARLERWRGWLRRQLGRIALRRWFGLERSARIRQALQVAGIGERAGASGGAPPGSGGGGELAAVRPVMSLLDLAAGEIARVDAMQSEHVPRLARLSAYGVAPGSRLKMIQTRPTVLIEVGGTRLALEGDVAACIQVHRIGP